MPFIVMTTPSEDAAVGNIEHHDYQSGQHEECLIAVSSLRNDIHAVYVLIVECLWQQMVAIICTIDMTNYR